jgi:hypothetical protein
LRVVSARRQGPRGLIATFRTNTENFGNHILKAGTYKTWAAQRG